MHPRRVLMSREPVHPDLLAEITAYMAEHKLTRQAFGLHALGDPSLLADLENGRELRRSTEERVRERLSVPPAGEAA